MKKINPLILFTCLLVFVFAAQAQDNASVSKSLAYDELLKKVKGGDTNIDFRTFRFAFTETKNYSTFGSDTETRNKMFAALSANNFKEALGLADAELEKDYTNLNNHFIAFAAHKELGNAEKSDFHKKIIDKLLASITRGNDGATSKTAFEVIVVEEERNMLRFLGYMVTKQELVKQDGHTYDLITAVHRNTKETARFYFNVDKVFEKYEKMLTPKN